MARTLKGIRRRGNTWRAFVRIHGHLYTKTFELSTAPEEMRRWRTEQQLRHGGPVAPPGGSFAHDIAKYLVRHATMPTLAQRAGHLELWARELGRDRTSASITAEDILLTTGIWAP